MPINPTNIKWTGPKTFSDGSPYEQADHKGFTLYFLNADGSTSTSVSVPVGWKTDYVYSFPIASLSLKKGAYRIAMTTVAASGLESDKSAAAEFTIAGIPVPPTDLAVV